MEEYRINGEGPSFTNTMLVRKVTTLTSAVDSFNALMNAIGDLSKVGLPEMDMDEMKEFHDTLGAVAFGMNKAGKLILESRRRTYEKHRVELDESEREFRVERVR